MQYIEPRPATIRTETDTFNGQISGSDQFVKFVCSDPAFVQLFPSGEFDTMEINYESLNRQQKDIIDFAQSMVRQYLND